MTVTTGLLRCAGVTAIGVVLDARASLDPAVVAGPGKPSRAERAVGSLRSAVSR